jgi:hypothetical protein
MTAGQGPLCPYLYDCLVERLGDVVITNAGEELKAIPRMNLATGRVEWDIREKGEHYFVNCPFCNDTRHRLGISYAYGQVDGATGRAATWLAHCFNEECLSKDTPFGPDNRRELEDRIFGFVNREERIGRLQVKPGYAPPRQLGIAEIPGRCVPLDRLAPSHPAVAYLESRGYDAAWLGGAHGVSYCVEAPMGLPTVQGRIVIPIVMDGVLRGWQARYVGDVDWKARNVRKYYNMPHGPTGLMLYNVDVATRHRVVVVVEGVTGVWTLGDAAVCVFGHSISSAQRAMLYSRWADRRGLFVLMLDPDADEKAARQFYEMRIAFEGKGGAAVMVRLPAGKDPGSYDRETAWAFVRAAAAEAGVDIAPYTETLG